VGEGGRAPLVAIIVPTGAARAAAAVVAILGKLLECIEGGTLPPCVVGEGASAFVAQRSVSTSCGGGDGRRSVIESRARRGGHAEPFPQRCRVHREGVGSYQESTCVAVPQPLQH